MDSERRTSVSKGLSGSAAGSTGVAAPAIRYQCLACAAILESSAKLVGSTEACPNCQWVNLVPDGDDPAPVGRLKRTQSL